MSLADPYIRKQNSYYALLGVDIMAGEDEIRLAYKRLALKWHPDRHSDSLEAKRRFQEIQHAYAVLSNEELRLEYDLQYVESLNIQEYLRRYHDFILTANGLGLQSEEHTGHRHLCMPGQWLTASQPSPMLTA